MTRVIDWCGELCLTSGNGDLQLGGAVNEKFTTFGSSLSDGDSVWYAIGDGVDREAGLGTYNATDNSIERTQVHAVLVDGAAWEILGAARRRTATAPGR